MAHSFLSKLLPVAVVVATLSLADRARADDNVCTTSSSIGTACKTAGPGKNQPGICESSPCDADAGAAHDGGACFACLVDGTQGLCGGGRPSDPKSSFTPTVGGCCSIAGTHSWETGAGLLLGMFFLGLAFAQRRRNLRR